MPPENTPTVRQLSDPCLDSYLCRPHISQIAYLQVIQIASLRDQHNTCRHTTRRYDTNRHIGATQRRSGAPKIPISTKNTARAQAPKLSHLASRKTRATLQ